MICTSGFVDDVKFHVMQGIGQNQRRHRYFVRLPGGGTSGTSDNVDSRDSQVIAQGGGGEVCDLQLQIVRFFPH